MGLLHRSSHPQSLRRGRWLGVAPAGGFNLKDMNDGSAAGVLAGLGDVNSLGSRIISRAANPVCIPLVFKRKVEFPDSIWRYIPGVFLPVLDRQEIVRIIRPDLIDVRISVTAFGTTGRVITVSPAAASRAVTPRSDALSSNEEQTAGP